MVDREHVDVPPVVRQLPARPALRRVPPRDRRRPTDVREVRQRAERAKALGEQPVRAVGARDVREARGPAVVRLVVVDRHRRFRRAERGGDEESEGREGEGLELHSGRGGGFVTRAEDELGSEAGECAAEVPLVH